MNMNTDPNTENDQEAQLKANLERIRALRFIDDEFMNVCFDDYIEGTQLMLRIILNKPDLIVTSVRTQRVLKSLTGRDIWLDIHAKDSTNAEFDIEVQRLESGADRRRARYHSSIMDAHLLESGQDFKLLPDSYVIFITETDVLKGNKPLYCIERMMMELKQPFNDGSHIVYVNGENRDSATALGRLMHDFFCTDPDDMYYPELANKARYFKENAKGVETMNSVLDEVRNEGALLERIKIAKNLLQKGKLSLEEIAETVKLSLEKIKELAKQNSVTTAPLQGAAQA